MSQSQISSSAYLFLHITILSILISSVAPKSPNGFSLELIHRDSAKLDERLRFELSFYDGTGYLVKLQFGNPSIPIYLVPDTGSDLFWTQCEPCEERFHQQPPIYNSSTSRTYSKLSCEHPFCRNNKSDFKCQNGECVYKIEYLSDSITEGVVASEIFHPDPSNNNTQMKIYFGCSRKSRNFGPYELSGRFGGILGLDMSPVSFLQQLGDITQQRFSYCLPPPVTQGNGTTFLRFGDEIVTQGRTFKSTPIVSPPNQYSYYLNLQDISVAGRRLNIPRNTFTLKRDGTGGCIVDSGTSITRLIAPAYQQVLKAFQAHFDSYGLQRVNATAETHLELCYRHRQTLPKVKLASMTYHFEGADFEVRPAFIYRTANDPDVFCVQISSSQSESILGSRQQINTRFIYDVRARKIYFSWEDCEGDR
ncbi:aspartic proteinase CDR1-like [Euphorbia lathyris]|uniref:aspartic proteinase CDR1-like n=1 Tax=Euphorbia lathyris TaxID=212925 RepID=UPI003314253A